MGDDRRDPHGHWVLPLRHVLVERAQLFGKATEIVHLQQQALDPDLPQVRLDDATELFGAFRLRISLVLR